MKEVSRESKNDSWVKHKKDGFRRPAVARHPTMSVRHQQAECSVPCALRIILFISRVFGVAPVGFVRRRDGWHVRVSRGMCFYSHPLFFLLSLGMLFGVVIDLGLHEEKAIRVRTKSATVVWILELCLLLLVITVGFCGGTGRMTSMIHSLNKVKKIKSKYNKGSNQESQRMKWFSSVGVIAVVLSTFMLYAFDVFTYATEALLHDKELMVVRLYTCFYVLSFTMVLMELQFIATAVLVKNGFKSLNKVLQDLIYDFDLKNNTEPIIDLQTKSINSLIDTMTLQGKTRLLGIQSSKISPKAFRDIVLSYGTMCDVVREIDRSHGLMVLLLLTTMLFHLIVTPYYLFVNMKFSPDNTSVNLGLQVWYIIFHTTKVIMLTEAGFITQFEMDKTRMLVSHVAGRTGTSDPLAGEVDLFFKQIELNKVGYAPLGMCTLTRPLIASIFGTVTTYLVIVLQFQSLDNS